MDACQRCEAHPSEERRSRWLITCAASHLDTAPHPPTTTSSIVFPPFSPADCLQGEPLRGAQLHGLHDLWERGGSGLLGPVHQRRVLGSLLMWVCCEGVGRNARMRLHLCAQTKQPGCRQCPAPSSLAALWLAGLALGDAGRQKAVANYSLGLCGITSH